MKVAVATDDYINVTGHIGRCKGFLVIETENGKIIKIEKRENNFTNHGRGMMHEGDGKHRLEHGGAHKDGHQRLAEGLSDCSHLICSGAGWRVQEDLNKVGVEIVLTSEQLCESAAVKLENGTLEINEDLSCNNH